MSRRRAHLFFTIFLCSTFHILHAQVIEGTVYDAKTRETLPGVVVYFDGTSIITASDHQGKFRLDAGKKINANLVFSHLSYESLIIQNPFEHSEKAFYLKEKVSTLAEVKIVADRFSHADKMRVFKDQFLGITVAGKSCVILNEEDVQLNYDHETFSLHAVSKNPLIIENRYLAYRITFDLHLFAVQYSDNTLNMEKATKVLFKGTSSFVDLNPYNIRFSTRREEAYLSSSKYFFKNLVENRLDQAKFKIYNRHTQVKQEQYFIVSGEPPKNVVLIIPNTNLNRRHSNVYVEPIYGVISILYQNKHRSEVVFLTNRFSVDESGNPDNIDDFIFFGMMGEQRLGDLLPRDFTLHVEL